MTAIHLIERLNNVRPVDRSVGEWESGYWAVSLQTAQRLIDADLYLHTRQEDRSHFGGKIVSFRVHRGAADIDGRIVFRIRASASYKGVAAGRDGWGNEKKIVWATE